jgi:hypothetical protein
MSMQGVIERIGSGELADVIVSPDWTMHSVPPGKRDVSMSYVIVPHTGGIQVDADGWEHYRYTFRYRYQGRRIDISWKCGTGYGEPQAIDGLRSAFLDAASVEWEAFGPSWAGDYGYDFDDLTDRRRAQRIYNACERMQERLTAFFQDAEEGEYQRWEEAMRDR